MTVTPSYELRGHNITVNAVATGPVGTELFLTGKDEALIERLCKLSPLERLGQPEDFANLVSFLAGPDGGWVNGQGLHANGGYGACGIWNLFNPQQAKAERYGQNGNAGVSICNGRFSICDVSVGPCGSHNINNRDSSNNGNGGNGELVNGNCGNGG